MPNLQATPYAYPAIGSINNLIGGLLGYMRDPRRTQQMQGLASLLEATGIPKTVERLAYDEPLTNIQKANVPALRPETADALMTLLPVSSGTNKAAMAAGRAGEQLAEKYVPQIMERGGMPAGLLQDLAQGSRSYAYRPSTPLKPDPSLGTRFEREFLGGLADKTPIKIEDYKGASIMLMPWDSTSRNFKITGISDEVLANPVITHGGQDYARDIEHINQQIAGASNLGIAKRIKDRDAMARIENINAGGTGEILQIKPIYQKTTLRYLMKA